VALVIADLCYMINLCYGDGDNLLSDNKVHSFLLAMRAFITTKGGHYYVLAFGIHLYKIIFYVLIKITIIILNMLL